jgi:predicted negative regulator of RcsB-dependent stress response
MSKYTRKQKSKEDEFVSFWHHVYNKAAPYATAIAVTLASAVVVWFVAFGITSWIDHRAEAAAEAFGRAVKIYDADLATDDSPPKTDEENPIPRFKTDKERAEAALAELDSVDKKFGGSNVAKDALVFRAGVYYDLGRFDEAAASYRKFLEGAKKDVPLSVLAREGVGLCAEARGQLDEALSAYQALEPKTGDYFRDRALYDQARIHLKKGDKQKAAALYQQVLTKMPQTPLRDEIQTQLALLEGQ